jgi:chromosome segregation ATPase
MTQDNIQQIADRYARLGRAYIKLSDKFQQLDVDYMTLKSKVVPLLKALKAYKQLANQLKQEKGDLQSQINALAAKYEELKSFEIFLKPEMQDILSEAEEQAELIDETLQEMDQNADPDLSDSDQSILHEYYSDPTAFVALNGNLPSNSGDPHAGDASGMAMR